MNKRLLISPLLLIITSALGVGAQPDLTPPTLPDAVRQQMQNDPPPWSASPGTASQFPQEPPRLIPPPLPPFLEPHQQPHDQFALLESFLELSPERLTSIRQTIEKIEAMDASQKATLLEAIQESRAAPPARAPQASINVSPQLNARIEALPEAQRADLRKEMRAFTSPEAQAAFAEGFLQALQYENARVGE